LRISWDLHVTSSCHRIKLYSVNRTRAATRERLAELAARQTEFEPLTLPLEYTLEETEDYLAACRKYPREPVC
jgi:sulfite oxidase